jgi:hypothetical protein
LQSLIRMVNLRAAFGERLLQRAERQFDAEAGT